MLELVLVAEGRAAPVNGMTAGNATEAGLTVAAQDGLGPILDEEAKKNYRRRLQELREEIAEAERNNDFERAASLEAEKDAFTQQLTEGLGLGGRHRKVGSNAEKARVNVRNQIREAIKRIERYDSAFAKFLKENIETGVFCQYTSDFPFSFTF